MVPAPPAPPSSPPLSPSPPRPSSSPAGGADEAAGVVGLPQGGDHLPLDEVPAAEAAGPVQVLVVQGADVVALAQEEAALSQLTAAH